ncbi:tRNA-queuosine alpha-mannosyltransferase-like [Liolophura sinensis]|uniref:tRNA-queuosine alpha-mannosyltransferase-like n=1 Tax=Liolophura sinensis TaxID=3198878 RepID=UPI0031588F11
MSSPMVVVVEPFYGGSHKQLLDLITMETGDHALFTMPSKKWHWRARTSALHFSQVIPSNSNYRVLFCSSVLNLAELVALRPDLGHLKKILYFHENQLVYPVRKQQDRDFQYGYNQILSSLVADVVVFNSQYNRDSFLGSIKTFLNIIPDQKSLQLEEQIRPKSLVLYFPLNLSHIAKEGSLSELVNDDLDVDGKNGEKVTSQKTCISMSDCEPTTTTYGCHGDKMTITKGFHDNQCSNNSAISESVTCDVYHENLDRKKKKAANFQAKSCGNQTKSVEDGIGVQKPLHIVWSHRWEHDKDPQTFFQVLYKLSSEGLSFTLSVMGEQFLDVPDVFQEAKEKLSNHISAWGYQGNKGDYYRVLLKADVAVSTALHEFFGVAMLEAVHLGCYPLCPNRLVYPEIFPKECLYNTSQQLYKRLRELCRRPHLARSSPVKNALDLDRFSWETLGPKYKHLLDVDGTTDVT